MHGAADEDLEARCRALVADLGLAAAAEEVRDVRPLTGGVASDIALVNLGGRRVCVKFALDRLKVAVEWHAPVRRNRAEYLWLQAAEAAVPGVAPRLLGRSERLDGFAMAFIGEEEAWLWKAGLLAGRAPAGEAAAVGDALGRIHAASTAPDFAAGGFDNRDDFHALRIEPYLLFTATRHPALAARLEAEARRLYERSGVLIHGDVSPKNILIRDGRPVFLDAECATMGDAAFDPAFCLNHLVLKAVHLPAERRVLLAEAGKLWAAYRAHVTWEEAGALERRVARLLAMLMLARIDGKSPVEYLDEAARRTVRGLAVRLVAAPPERLGDVFGSVEEGAA